MPKRCLGLAGVLMMACIGTAARADKTDIRDYVCQKLDDFTATMSVISVNEREMAKISKDALMLYKFRQVSMRYKEPNMVRIEGSQEGTKATFVMTGTQQWTSIPKMGFKQYRKFDAAPGKRKSLLDVGLVSDYYLTYTNAKYLRDGVVDGAPVGVFEVTYKATNLDTSKHILYIDPKTKVVRKHDAYTQTGKLQAVYHFKDLKQVALAIWFPTRIEAQNAEGKLAGVTGYDDIKVNQGLPDSLFKL